MQNQTIQLVISGMHCASCVASIENALAQVPGVVNAAVNFANKLATVTVHHEVPAAVLIAAVDKVGYQAELVGSRHDMIDHSHHETQQFKAVLLRALLAFGVGVPLLIDMHWPWLPSITAQSIQWPWVVVSIFSFAVLWFCGGTFFRGAWQGLKHFSANMDTLVAMGTGVAWLYSTCVVFFPMFLPEMARQVYFEASNILIAFILFGNALELKARGKTSEAIKALIGLQPKTATVMRNNQPVQIPISDLHLDEIVRVKPGEKIAVDGVLVEGESYVDESMLTGESMPVQKNRGDTVSAGTINKSGSFEFKVTKVGKDTALAQIIKLVESAQGSKPSIAKLADKIASVFVPAVILIAIVTAIIWSFVAPEPRIAFVLTTSIAVLVIACPCALGLATPISVMVGVGKAAQMGILIRNGDSLQIAKQLTTIVFDKTGTLTQGAPAVTKVIAYQTDRDTILKLAASVENNSEHPLARAIIKAADDRDSETVSKFNAYSGLGASAIVAGKTILIGNTKLMQQHKIAIAAAQKDIETLSGQGNTVVLIAQENKLLGIIAIADPIKENAKSVIDQLHNMKLSVVMLTGDNAKTANSVAKKLGIDHVFAEVLPQDKAAAIKKLQAQKKIVAMVGDGINDAPALAQANLGFAMGGGTDVAIESADVTLMNNQLSTVISAIKLSRATVRNIKQNLFGAFIYNVSAIPLAAGLFFPFTGWLLNPMIAGLAMAMSSVTVVLNASRLRFFK